MGHHRIPNRFGCEIWKCSMAIALAGRTTQHNSAAIHYDSLANTSGAI
jgi:hypothetical protein